jgi:hypothetical protein
LNTSELSERDRREYTLRTKVDHLRRQVFGQTDPSASPVLMEELAHAEKELEAAEVKRIASRDPDSGLILAMADTSTPRGTRGSETTGLEAKVYIAMEHVPTSICHVLDATRTPLVTCTIKATKRLPDKPNKRRVRVSSYIEGYSATAVSMFELAIGEEHTFQQLPTLFPGRTRTVTELTRATLHVLAEDLDGAIEVHETKPVWLLARTTAPLGVTNPQTGEWQDLTLYLGAFVTPNAPSLMSFLREAARLHPQGLLTGYQGSQEDVAPQVKALFDALKSKAEITYVNSVISFNPQRGFATQRVRLPRESLADKEANCIDGTVLFASLLEGISMNPAIVLIPGHAFVAWETWSGSNEWRFLETTMIGSSTFEQACGSGETTAQVYASKKELQLLPLNVLRMKLVITPME